MNKILKTNEEGFSMIELLVAVIIMGILTAIAVPIYLNQQKEAHKAVLKQDVFSTATEIGVKVAGMETKKDLINMNNVFNKTDPKSTMRIHVYKKTDTYNLNNGLLEYCVWGQNIIAGETVAYAYNVESRKLVEGACSPSDSSYLAFTTQTVNPT